MVDHAAVQGPYQSMGVPPEDAQFLGVRLFQVQEVARWFGMPPVKLGDFSRATYSNAEQAQLEYFSNCLRRWLTRWEAAIAMQLLSDDERNHYYAEHLADAILRADQKTRYESYAAGRTAGFLSANDIRRLENLDPITDGDSYLVPLNMAAAGGNAAAQAARAALVDTVERFVRREAEHARRNLATPARFGVWLDTYAERDREIFVTMVRATLRTYLATIGRGQLDVEATAAQLADRYFEQSQRELRPFVGLEGEALRGGLERRLSLWERDRAPLTVDACISSL